MLWYLFPVSIVPEHLRKRITENDSYRKPREKKIFE